MFYSFYPLLSASRLLVLYSLPNNLTHFHPLSIFTLFTHLSLPLFFFLLYSLFNNSTHFHTLYSFSLSTSLPPSRFLVLYFSLCFYFFYSYLYRIPYASLLSFLFLPFSRLFVQIQFIHFHSLYRFILVSSIFLTLSLSLSPSFVLILYLLFSFSFTLSTHSPIKFLFSFSKQ